MILSEASATSPDHALTAGFVVGLNGSGREIPRPTENSENTRKCRVPTARSKPGEHVHDHSTKHRSHPDHAYRQPAAATRRARYDEGEIRRPALRPEDVRRDDRQGGRGQRAQTDR